MLAGSFGGNVLLLDHLGQDARLFHEVGPLFGSRHALAEKVVVGLLGVEQDVGAGLDEGRNVLDDGDLAIIEVIPLFVILVLEVGEVVSVGHVAFMVHHSVQVVDWFFSLHRVA